MPELGVCEPTKGNIGAFVNAHIGVTRAAEVDHAVALAVDHGAVDEFSSAVAVIAVNRFHSRPSIIDASSSGDNVSMPSSLQSCTMASIRRDMRFVVYLLEP